MIKLDTLQEICSGLSWAYQINPLKEDFVVDVTLPFPFYQALQNEIIGKVTNSGMLVNESNIDIKQPMKFTKLVLPTGVRVNIKESKELIEIKVVKKQKPDANQLLLPFNAERN